MIPEPASPPPPTATLEHLGLHNVLNRVARGERDIDPLLLHTLRQKGFISEEFTLTGEGEDELRRLTVVLGWFLPDD